MLYMWIGLGVSVYDLSESNVDDALKVCTPEHLKNIPSYVAGLRVRRDWLLELYRTLGPCCKIAYFDDIPVGMIQYTPLHQIPYFPTKREDVLYIYCMYVRRDFRGRGIGSKLLNVLVNEMRTTNPLFKERTCRVLVTTARQHMRFKLPSYFIRKGFRRTKDNVDVGLAYFLSEKLPGERLDIATSNPVQVREKGVRIFYTPTCQYCIFWNERIRKFVTEVKPNTRIEEVNIWAQPAEAIRRKITSPVTYVNGKPILPTDPEKFYEKIRLFLLET